MFTKTEKTILNALPKEYEYIFRSPRGDLRISGRFDDVGYYLPICEFNHIFKDVKAGADPICFRKPILDDIEREYLKTVFKPFRNRIKWVEKCVSYSVKGKCYIWVCVDDDDNLEFPTFDKRKMYNGMNIGKCYTLEELGITYD